MKKIKLNYLLRLCLFWLIYFASFRILFILYHHARIPDGRHSETSLAMLYSIPMDAAITAFFLFIPYLLWSFQQFYKNKTIHRLNKLYNYSLVIVVTMICVFNIKCYGEFDTMLTTEELAYLLYPKEAITFISFWSLLFLFGSVVLFSVLAIRAYKKYLYNFSQPIEQTKVRWMLVCIMPVLLFFVARGGIRSRPLEASVSHYSRLRIDNDIATNPIWYLGYSYCNKTSKP